MTAERAILSFDPGVTTGVAVVLLRPSCEPEVDHMGQFQDFVSVYTLISAYRKRNFALQIVTEDIVGSGFRTVDLVRSIQVEGYIIGLAETLRLPIAKQPPQTRNPFKVDAAKMSAKGTKHARDALAHALAFLYKEAQSGRK